MRKAARYVFMAAFIALIASAMLGMRPFGEPSDSRMDDHFIANSEEDTGSNNVVTAVVFDYRGLDTLGETTVLFAAVCGIFIVFLGGKKR